MNQVAPFKKPNNMELVITAMQPFFDDLKTRNISVSPFTHHNAYTLYDIKNPEDGESLQLFIRSDGKMESVYGQNPMRRSFNGVLDSHDMRDALSQSFVKRFKKALESMNIPYDDGVLTKALEQIKNLKLKLQSGLQDPSLMHSQWQQARGNRDGVTNGGVTIPHLL